VPGDACAARARCVCCSLSVLPLDYVYLAEIHSYTGGIRRFSMILAWILACVPPGQRPMPTILLSVYGTALPAGKACILLLTLYVGPLLVFGLSFEAPFVPRFLPVGACLAHVVGIVPASP